MSHARILPAAGPLRPPRSLIGSLRANADPRAIITELREGFDRFRAHHEGELRNVQISLDDIQARVGAIALSGGIGPEDTVALDPGYSRQFTDWMRAGRNEPELLAAHQTGPRSIIRAAMSTGSNGDGGYLAPVEWDRNIQKALTAVSQLRNVCSVITTTTGGYSTVWSNGQIGSGWVGETAARPQTTTPTLAPVTFKTGELYAQPAITQTLLEDGAIDVGLWLSTQVADEFARQEAIAFITGDGVNKPQGFLSYLGTGTSLHPGGAPTVVPSGAAAAVNPDGLIDLVYGLPSPYRSQAAWLMNSMTAAAVRKFKDTGGQYLWQPALDQGAYPTLLGFPVVIEEAMPDIAAGATPIAFGNWRLFYVINDRLGTSILRDPYTAKPYVLFYTRKRVGGGILDPRAVRFLKVGTS